MAKTGDIDYTSQDQDSFLVRHRNPLAGDYVIVSQVVLVGYPQVSDGAKLTYWVIYGHDWHERSRGGRKGYAYPTVGRIAQLRHTTPRTIQRHLQELITVGLLTRELRPGKRSILYIEEPSHEQVEQYLEMREQGGDKNVGGVVTKMSPHKKANIKQEKTVNGDEKAKMEEGSDTSDGWQPISRVVSQMVVTRKPIEQKEWLADQILSATEDERSMGCYRTIASRCRQELVFEALSLLKEARRDSQIQSRGAFFVATIRRLCKERNLPDPLGRRAS